MHGRQGNAVLGELDASGLEIEMPRVSALPSAEAGAALAPAAIGPASRLCERRDS
jgi:hypothetical protein